AAEFGEAAILVCWLDSYDGEPHPDTTALVEDALVAVGEELVSTRIELLDTLTLRDPRRVTEANYSKHAAYASEAVTLARSTGDSRLLAETLAAPARPHNGPNSA